MLRRIASSLIVLLASIAFIATPAPPDYPIAKQEQSNTIVLSPQIAKVERKIIIEIDPKFLSRSVESGLNPYDSVLSVGVYPEQITPEVLEKLKKLSVKIYSANRQENPREDHSFKKEQGAFLPLATSEMYRNCTDHRACHEEFEVVFEAAGLIEELTFSWVALAQLGGAHPNKTPEKALGALRVLIK